MKGKNEQLRIKIDTKLLVFTFPRSNSDRG